MKLYFVKLGGSIITDTEKANTPKLKEIDRLVKEIKEGSKGARVIIGHGSGSFGHVAVRKYGLEKGLHGNESILGAAKTHIIAHELNRLLIKSLNKNGISALPFPPSAGGISRKGRISYWNIEPIKTALAVGFTPVVMGDVIVDSIKGIHIASTEEGFEYLAARFKPDKVISADDTDGVFDADPKIYKNAKLIRKINKKNIREALKSAGPSLKVDVTGGMHSKLQFLYNISKRYGSTCQIVNATVPGRLRDALMGKPVVSTIIKAKG
ncbi:MAG: isopentenyl phosphate kinase [Candidatus Micrarchaeaceae archaeon]